MGRAVDPSVTSDASTRVWRVGRTSVVAVRGALRGTEELAARMSSLAGSCRAIVLDLRDVPFADSDGIRALLRLQADLAERQVRLALVVPAGSTVRRALQLLGFDRLLDLHQSARQAFRAAPRRRLAA